MHARPQIRPENSSSTKLFTFNIDCIRCGGIGVAFALEIFNYVLWHFFIGKMLAKRYDYFGQEIRSIMNSLRKLDIFLTKYPTQRLNFKYTVLFL